MGLSSSKRPVRDHNIKPGDHISWRRYLGYYHHAIVTCILSSRRVTVIHFAPPDDKSAKGKIIEQHIDLTKEAGDLEVVRHPNNCSAATVIGRAQSQIGKTGYNFVFNNCEHFATWCKTGVKECKQKAQAAKDLAKTAGSALSTMIKRGATKIPGLAVATTVLTEACTFVTKYIDKTRRYIRGEISKSERNRAVGGDVVKSVGSVGGKLGGAWVGCSIGSFAGPLGSLIGTGIGYLAGGFFGRFASSWLGKKIFG